MKNSLNLCFGLIFLALASITSALKEGDCEVCIKTVEKFASTLDDATKSDPKKIEEVFRKFCKTSKNKENRFVSFRKQIDDVLIFASESADYSNSGTC